MKELILIPAMYRNIEPLRATIPIVYPDMARIIPRSGKWYPEPSNLALHDEKGDRIHFGEFDTAEEAARRLVELGCGPVSMPCNREVSKADLVEAVRHVRSAERAIRDAEKHRVEMEQILENLAMRAARLEYPLSEEDDEVEVFFDSYHLVLKPASKRPNVTVREINVIS